MLLPKFVDKHPSFNPSGYIVTNEEPELFNTLLGDVKVQTAACIASGGEVLLSVILPRAKKVYAVDHSYRAHAATMLKMGLVQRLGDTGFRLALFHEDYATIQKIQSELWSDLPEIVRNKSDKYFIADKYNTMELRKAWAGIKSPKLTKTAIKRVTLIHGDMTDVPGPVDMLYVSNAMEHENRNGENPTLQNLAPLLNPGGYLLFTMGNSTFRMSHYGYKKIEEEQFFERVGTCKGVHSSSWVYLVLRKKQDQPVAVPPQNQPPQNI